jgi:hypothetical protein
MQPNRQSINISIDTNSTTNETNSNKTEKEESFEK